MLMVDRFLLKWTTLLRNGDSLSIDVQLLKKGNFKLVKSSFNQKGLIIINVSSHKNGSFRSHQTRRRMINAFNGGIVSLWSSYYFATQVYTQNVKCSLKSVTLCKFTTWYADVLADKPHPRFGGGGGVICKVNSISNDVLGLCCR